MTNDETTRTNRRAARIVTTALVAGGVALAGGSAYASADAGQERVAAAAATAAGEEVTAGEVPAPTSPVAEQSPAELAALDAYFAAGYTYDDAVALGNAWNVDFYEAKVLAGEKLTAGEALPVAAGSTAPDGPGQSAEEAAAVEAFFGAGYDYDDAVELGALWNVEPYEAKVTGGGELLAGGTLPIAV